jgi:predicted methyltransferase
MNRPRPLTALARDAVAAVLSPGDRAIDATMGNGHDTLFMARQVAPDGRVIAFDIQRSALDKTRARLDAAGLSPLVELALCSHAEMLSRLPADWPGSVAAVMFNLGYLPGGDKTVVTRAQSTLSALDQALTVLRPGGLLSLLLYRGHCGADAETAAFMQWLQCLPPGHPVVRHESPGPVLFLINRPGPPS